MASVLVYPKFLKCPKSGLLILFWGTLFLNLTIDTSEIFFSLLNFWYIYLFDWLILYVPQDN
jgi:hypothetical protein